MIKKAEVNEFATVEELFEEVKTIRKRTARAWVFIPNQVILLLGKGYVRGISADEPSIWATYEFNGEEVTFDLEEPEEAYFFSLK